MSEERDIAPFTMYLNRNGNDSTRLEWSLFKAQWTTVGRSYEQVEAKKWGTYNPEYIELDGHQLSAREIATLSEQEQLNVGKTAEIVVINESNIQWQEFTEEEVATLRRQRGIS